MKDGKRWTFYRDRAGECKKQGILTGNHCDCSWCECIREIGWAMIIWDQDHYYGKVR